MIELIDVLDFDEIETKHLLEKEVSRFNKLRSAMGVSNEKLKANQMDIRGYAKYLLAEGSAVEKRGLLEHMRGKIVMKDKKIKLND